MCVRSRVEQIPNAVLRPLVALAYAAITVLSKGKEMMGRDCSEKSRSSRDGNHTCAWKSKRNGLPHSLMFGSLVRVVESAWSDCGMGGVYISRATVRVLCSQVVLRPRPTRKASPKITPVRRAAPLRAARQRLYTLFGTFAARAESQNRVAEQRKRVWNFPS